ncbi:hypothetical protein HK096_000626, partial [Nowakowskiella sp. JEL0078]
MASCESPNILALKQYLNTASKISVSDGRLFEGQFVGVDKEKNVLLAGTTEYNK